MWKSGFRTLKHFVFFCKNWQFLFLRSNPEQIGSIEYQGEIWIFDVKLGWTWVFMSDLIKCVISEIKLDRTIFETEIKFLSFIQFTHHLQSRKGSTCQLRHTNMILSVSTRFMCRFIISVVVLQWLPFMRFCAVSICIWVMFISK